MLEELPGVIRQLLHVGREQSVQPLVMLKIIVDCEITIIHILIDLRYGRIGFFKIREVPTPLIETLIYRTIRVAHFQVVGHGTCSKCVNLWLHTPNDVFVKNGTIHKLSFFA